MPNPRLIASAAGLGLLALALPASAASFIANPSFEASRDIIAGMPAPGQRIAGWTLGGAGTAGALGSGTGPADNGSPPDQNHVGFIQRFN